MSAPKIAAIIVASTLGLVAWYVSSMLYPIEKPPPKVTNVEKFLALLTNKNTKISVDEEERLNKNGLGRQEWIRMDKQHFSLSLPTNILATYGEVYLSIYQDSAITCGEVKFDSHRERWGHFISSRRANVALIEGDHQLSDEEFMQIYSIVC